jgi:hypothetical protein
MNFVRGVLSMKKIIAWIVCAGCLGWMPGAINAAWADTFSFTLGTPNSAISGYTGPYEQVTVTTSGANATTATITFTSLTSGGNIYLMGDGSSVAVNVNATSFTLGTVTGSNSGTGFTATTFTNAGSGNVNGFGSFNLNINSFDGFSNSSSTISFTLTDNSGTWASAADVLAANANGSLAAAHVFVTSSPANVNNGALATGFASNGIETPLPGALALFGSVLFGGLGAATWRRRRRGSISVLGGPISAIG